MMIETVAFKLKSQADEEQFVANVTALISDFIAKQKGFIKVELGKDLATGEWIAIHYFDTIADNDIGIQNTRSSEIWKRDTANINPATIARRQYDIVIP